MPDLLLILERVLKEIRYESTYAAKTVRTLLTTPQLTRPFRQPFTPVSMQGETWLADQEADTEVWDAPLSADYDDESAHKCLPSETGRCLSCGIAQPTKAKLIRDWMFASEEQFLHGVGEGGPYIGTERTTHLLPQHRGSQWVGHAGWVYSADGDGWLGKLEGQEDIWLSPRHDTSSYGPYVKSPAGMQAAAEDPPRGAEEASRGADSGTGPCPTCTYETAFYPDPCIVCGDKATASRGEHMSWATYIQPALLDVLADHQFYGAGTGGCDCGEPVRDHYDWREHVAPLIAKALRGAW